MTDGHPDGLEDRVLILAPTARDGAASRDLLAGAGVRAVLCATIADVCREAARGAGAALVTAEAVVGDGGGRLAALLGAQPEWSDLPLIVLTPPGPDSPKLLRALEAVGPMTLMKRPVQVASLVSAARAALRDRRRQYAVRALLAERERAADVLRAERERYQVTLSSIGDAVIATDAAGAVTFLNPVAESLTGWPAAEATGRPLTDVFHIVNETTRREVENPALRALASGVVVGLANHTVLIARGGTERPIDDSAAPIRDERGTVGAVLVFRDIAERRAAEDALRASEQRHRVLVTATSDVVYRMSADWTELYPLDGRGLVASNAEPIRGWMEKNLPASEHARVTAAIAAAVAGRQPFEVEHRVVRADGSAGWTLSRAAPILDAAGAVVEWFGTARDVTDRKLAEDRLRLAEERFRAAVAVTSEIMWTNDAAGLMTADQPGWEAFTGQAPEEYRGYGWAAAVHPDDARSTVDEWNRAVADQRTFVFEHRVRRRDGEYREFSIRAVPLRDPDGSVREWVGTHTDITARKRAEEVLREVDRKKDDFIALLAHELRNPLAPIRNGLQVIRLSKDSPTRERAQAMMDRQLGHMVRMIDDLLDVSRIGRNKMELRRDRITLAEVVASAVETARPAIDEAGHELTLAVPSDPIHLDADLTRLAQVVSNLLTNSAKYTPRGGTIWLTAARKGGDATVSVRDSGIGIPAEALESVFDLFSQVDRTFERSSGGLGIGLALVKGLVEMHGGTAAAQSAGPGRGSTFTVTLPVAADEPVLGLAPTGAGAAAGRQARRVLVVDDNRDGAESMADMLGVFGDEVRTAHDGLEAVATAEAFRPEVILMDIGMPRLNGLDATRRIRAQPWGAPITIIALTGWGQENDRERSREAGCDSHLVKPVSLSDLEKLLAEIRPAR